MQAAAAEGFLTIKVEVTYQEAQAAAELVVVLLELLMELMGLAAAAEEQVADTATLAMAVQE
jgi:hypothetical protein